MMAQQLAVGAEPCFEFLKLIKPGDRIEVFSSLPRAKEWVKLYRNHRQMQRSVIECLRRSGRNGKLVAEFAEVIFLGRGTLGKALDSIKKGFEKMRPFERRRFISEVQKEENRLYSLHLADIESDIIGKVNEGFYRKLNEALNEPEMVFFLRDWIPCWFLYREYPARLLRRARLSDVETTEKHLPIFTFLRFTGCRPNEARGLLRENVRLREENPFVVISTTIGLHGEIRHRTKTRSIRVLPIISEIKDALKPREATKWAFTQGGRPYSIWRLERIWNTACKRAGISVNLYNGLKHSFGCQRIEQGFNKSDLKEVFGHRDMRSVDRYAKYQLGRVGEIMRGKICANLVQEKNEVYNYAK